jgi:mono/diheme cytochrome c family protein
MRASKRTSMIAVGVTLALLVIFGVVFVTEFVLATNDAAIQDGEARASSDEDYAGIVQPLLVNADASNGEQLVTDGYECHVCHILGEGQQGPGYSEIAGHAAERGELSLAAYIYESIVHPNAFVVTGYPNPSSMPRNYGDRLSDAELGDIIAYLLQQADA